MVTRGPVSRKPKNRPRTNGTSIRNPVAMTSNGIHQGDHTTVLLRVQSASSPQRAHTGGIHPASTSCKCRSIDAMNRPCSGTGPHANATNEIDYTVVPGAAVGQDSDPVR